MGQRALVKVRPRCGIDYTGPNDAWVRTRVTRAMQAQMGNRITRSWLGIDKNTVSSIR